MDKYSGKLIESAFFCLIDWLSLIYPGCEWYATKICYYRLLRRFPVPLDPFILAQRRRYQQRTVLMIIATMVAFLLSWSPYCIVSFTATIKGHHVLTSGEAEIPELMAKASVVYNPIIYIIMNERFRRTLVRIIIGNNRPRVAPDEATDHNFIISAPRNFGRENNLVITTTAEIWANTSSNHWLWSAYVA